MPSASEALSVGTVSVSFVTLAEEDLLAVVLVAPRTSASAAAELSASVLITTGVTFVVLSSDVSFESVDSSLYEGLTAFLEASILACSAAVLALCASALARFLAVSASERAVFAASSFSLAFSSAVLPTLVCETESLSSTAWASATA